MSFSHVNTRFHAPRSIASLTALLRILPRVSRSGSTALAMVTLLSSLIPIAMVVAIGRLVGTLPDAVSHGIDSSSGHTAEFLLALIAVLAITQRILGPVASALGAALGRRLEYFLQESAMASVSRLRGIAHLESEQILNLLQPVCEITTVMSRPERCVQALAQVLPGWIQSMGAAAILLVFHWWVGLAWLIFWPILLIGLQREFMKTSEVAFGQSESLRRAAYLRDLAIRPQGAKEIRIWLMCNWLIERFDKAWHTAMEPVWRARRPKTKAVLGSGLIILALNGTSYGMLAYAAWRKDLSLGALAVFIQALASANNFAVDDSNAFVILGALLIPKFHELDRTLQRSPELAPQSDTKLNEFAECLILDRVAFAYHRERSSTADRPVIDNLDLKIAANTSLAIVGSNGAGKSTLIKLICGLYQPTAGAISVDGHTLSDRNVRSWQGQIAALFQDYARYELTVRDNISLGAPDIAGDFDRLRSAADKAGALSLIERLPEKWDTVLCTSYKGGVDLSGGQWQRIAMARAMFAVEAGARLLILDEPTAALDIRAESDLYNRFLDLTENLTTVLVSHRFSTVRRADRILVLNDGAIAEDGSHETLIEQDGQYARMFRLQANLYKGDS